MLENRPGIARHNGGVIEKVKKASAMTCKDDLFLGAFDGGREMQIVCVLELLTGLRRC
jgi:hypothetical protein